MEKKQRLSVLLFIIVGAIGFCSQSLADFPPASSWERNEVNLLSGFYNLYNPHILTVPGDTYPYKMYFMGWSVAESNPGYPGSDAIFLARSQSLDGPWEVYSDANGWQGDDQIGLWVPVLTADNKYYDEWHNGDPSVVYEDGTYYMAYSATGWDLDGYATGHPSDTDGWLTCVMGATSTDGIHWTRSSYPIMIGPDVGVDEGDYSPPYTGEFARPSLMWDEDHWRLWFDYWHPAHGVCTAHAECYGDPMDDDDWTMTHDIGSPVIVNWPNPDVITFDGKYYSAADPGNYPPYATHPWRRRQIRPAVSDDGISWTISDWFAPDSDSAANHVPELFVEDINGQHWMYIFYACQIGGEPIYDWKYDRIRSMRAPLDGGGSAVVLVNGSFELPAGVTTPDLEADYGLTGWIFRTAGGVGTVAHAQLDGVAPSDGSQAAAIHNDYDYAGYQGLYQDLIGGFTNGQEIDITFDLAIGQTSSQGIPAVSAWFAELMSDGAGGIAAFGAYNLIFNDWVADDATWDNVVAPTQTVSNFGTAAGQVMGYRLEIRPYSWNLPSGSIPGNSADAFAYVLVDNVVVSVPIPPTKCPIVDFDDDCDTDFGDFAIFAQNCLLDRDIDFGDLAVFAQSWLLDCEAEPENPNCVEVP